MFSTDPFLQTSPDARPDDEVGKPARLSPAVPFILPDTLSFTPGSDVSLPTVTLPVLKAMRAIFWYVDASVPAVWLSPVRRATTPMDDTMLIPAIYPVATYLTTEPSNLQLLMSIALLLTFWIYKSLLPDVLTFSALAELREITLSVVVPSSAKEIVPVVAKLLIPESVPPVTDMLLEFWVAIVPSPSAVREADAE